MTNAAGSPCHHGVTTGEWLVWAPRQPSAKTLPQNRLPERHRSHDYFAKHVCFTCEPNGLSAVTVACLGAKKLLEQRSPLIKLLVP